MVSVPRNQLMKQKLLVNQTLENMALFSIQNLATLFDGISRYSQEGLNFKTRSETTVRKQAVKERDSGTFDWMENVPFEQDSND